MTQQPWPQYAPPPPPPRRDRATLFVVLGVVAALVIAGVVTVVLVLSDPVDRAGKPGPTADERFTSVRDDAQQAGEEAAVVFNTLDYETIDADLDRWESMATGDLLTEVKNSRASSKQAIEQAKSKTTAKVLAAALSELDTEKGTARMIAAVRVGITQNGLNPTEKRIRVQLTLRKTSEGWKTNEIGQVPVDG